ncbi:DUF975 family protein [Butyrivibrio sp. FCS014]|uniref:DUF975 family protein n=1 Tax=Butyrivibrio sp. FCS014 TaxID=1408304 RepID=UPI0004677E5A|nr:DUF975 family protein [Butyrivibrio sp. FCS014]
MWNRKEVKTRGKINFKKNYWKSVLVAFIAGLFATSTAVATRRTSSSEEASQAFQNILEDPNAVFYLAAIAGALSTVMIILKLVDLFLFNPLQVGCNRFFVVNQHVNAEVGEVAHAFRFNYLTTVLALFLKDLLIGLASLLFLIPGIILSFSYRLVPFILADDPTISATDAIKKSRTMMKGHKWRSFVYDLSFFGWYILAVFTLNIVGLLYVNPYKMNADAALYESIKAANGYAVEAPQPAEPQQF